VNGKWAKLMLMSGITSAWLLYAMATATQAPSRALAILQYGLLACAPIGLGGAGDAHVGKVTCDPGA
jgi:hypothetical protein